MAAALEWPRNEIIALIIAGIKLAQVTKEAFVLSLEIAPRAARALLASVLVPFRLLPFSFSFSPSIIQKKKKNDASQSLPRLSH